MRHGQPTRASDQGQNQGQDQDQGQNQARAKLGVSEFMKVSRLVRAAMTAKKLPGGRAMAVPWPRRPG